MQISISMNIPMGHRLAKHPGKCRNYHGHNYDIIVCIEGAISPETGMVMDFTDLKAAMRIMLAPYDHAMVLEEGDPLIPFLSEHGFKYVITEFPPTAEHFARHFRLRIADRLTWNLDQVTCLVSETPDSDAIS